MTSEGAEEALISALWTGKNEVAQLMLPVCVNTSIRDKHGFTPLTLACMFGDSKTAETLIKSGVDINEKITISSTFKKKVVPPRVSKGLKAVCNLVDSVSPYSFYFDSHLSALTLAACVGDEKIVQLLLEKGAVINCCGNDEYTPLMGASANGHINIVRILLERGADARITNVFKRVPGRSALEIAACGHVPGIVKILASKSLFKQRNSALALAVMNGRKEIVKVLLEEGADVNVELENGGGLLTAAPNEAVARLLIDAGAHVNTKKADGTTALMCAATASDRDVMPQ